MKTDKKKALCFTCLLSVMAFGLMAIICTGGGCSGNGEGGRSIESSGIRLNEVLFFASTGPEWIELYNSSSDPMDIGLFQISNEKGDAYDIPEELPPVPPGGYVVILFDGLGYNQNDYDFDDGYAVLHTDTFSGDVFDNTSDSCTLYSGSFGNSGSKVDFVAWGDYAHDGHYVNNAEGYGSIGPVEPNQTIGVHPDVYTALIGVHWVIYAENETTQEGKNAIPAPGPLFPYQNSQLGINTMSFAWSDWFINIKEFHLEMDDNDDFSSPMISIRTKGCPYHHDASLQDGKYYWRVKAITKNSEESLWSQTYTFEIQTSNRSDLVFYMDLGLQPYLLQQRDTHLLCPACAEKSSTADKHTWDEPHTGSPQSHWSCDHCRVYCGRASVAMLIRHFGGEVSQDRLSYAVYKAQTKYAAQLGHGKGFSPPADITKALKYGLKDSAYLVPEPDPPKKVTFSKIQQYIIEHRPLIATQVGHAMVIDGFEEYEDPSENRVHIIDPWIKKEVSFRFSTCDLLQIWAPRYFSVGIKEEDLKADYDGDEISDFDEINRFKSNPNMFDTDGDGISDKVEIWAWAFGKGTKPRRPDIKGGIWLTPNFDKDPYRDGDEDLNKNGNVDPGECDPFVADTPIKISFKIAGATTGPPVVRINDKVVGPIPIGTSAGYHEHEVLFLWCGTLVPGSMDNTFTIWPFQIPSADYIGDIQPHMGGDHDWIDDIQVRDIKIIDQDDNNNVLLDEPKPIHIGNNSLQSIKELHEAKKWHDPNPPEFWKELDGGTLKIYFYWKGNSS